jgi:festuclavine dehydrogenase
MTTLITGGTGKTGLLLARLLTDAGHPVLLTSRKGEAPAPFNAVKFDWYDRTTFENPFAADPTIDRVYIIAPDSLHPGPIAKPFIDLTIAKGVKRFVLLGGTHQSSESLDTGEVQKLLEESGADYAVLKATWFQGVS